MEIARPAASFSLPEAHSRSTKSKFSGLESWNCSPQPPTLSWSDMEVFRKRPRFLLAKMLLEWKKSNRFWVLFQAPQTLTPRRQNSSIYSILLISAKVCVCVGGEPGLDESLLKKQRISFLGSHPTSPWLSSMPTFSPWICFFPPVAAGLTSTLLALAKPLKF